MLFTNKTVNMSDNDNTASKYLTYSLTRFLSLQALLTFLILSILCLAYSPNANSSNKNTYSHSPEYVISVDKSQQSLNILQRKSPLKKLETFPCSTGNNKGNKMVEGDERTPEGIYFLEYKRSKGLNYELYGNLAYVLNYPNPVDIIEDKTGHGIWLHGRGKKLVPRDTEGCVAVQTVKLRTLEKYIQPGETPVLISEKSRSTQNQTKLNHTANYLVQKIKSWEKAWENKSKEFFSFYAPKKFSQSSYLSFQGFKDKKQRLFRDYKWISIYLDEIRALPASDYWVTYFYEFFRSPKYSNQGIKRLYWQNIDGNWKIVGTEWRNRDMGLPEKYLKTVRTRIQDWLNNWKRAWENADLENYIKYYTLQAKQDARLGRKEIKNYKQNIWEQEKPCSIKIKDLQIDYHSQGFALKFKQRYTGKKGYQDTGIKKLLIRPSRKNYKIVQEDWKPDQSAIR